MNTTAATTTTTATSRSTGVESVPQVWDEARDASFFAITARLFPTQFAFGASVLLSSYDD